MMFLDNQLAEWLFGLAYRRPFFDSLAVFLAEPLLYFLALGALAFILLESDIRRRWFIFAEACLVGILSRGVITEAFHFFYERPRPYAVYSWEPLVSETSNSFPSGHAAFLFGLAAILFIYSRRWGIWFFILALVNGAARIFAGVHWPTDILGGIAVGILSAWLIHLWLKRYFPGQQIAEPPR